MVKWILEVRARVIGDDNRLVKLLSEEASILKRRGKPLRVIFIFSG